MTILLFDVDGTLCDSGRKISKRMSFMLNKLMNKLDKNNKNILIGIVGGGTYEKILYQLDNQIKPTYIFSECGSVYHKLNSISNKYDLLHKNELRNEKYYDKINLLVKTCLKYISNLNCMVTGHFIDLRHGLVYVSLIGMNATCDERNAFIEEDNKHNYRLKLINILRAQSTQLEINDYLDICVGGKVGIAIYPKKWNKVQVLDLLNMKEKDNIHYFGDQYMPNGNDYELLTNKNIIPHIVDNPIQTLYKLYQLYKTI